MIAAISCVCIYRHMYISFYLQPREVPKAMTTAYLLWFFFGLMGAHRYENICIYVCIIHKEREGGREGERERERERENAIH